MILYHFGDAEQSIPNLRDIPIMSEFANVFPSEIPGLPPRRAIDLIIDIVLGAKPISKPPYRMAPKE